MNVECHVATDFCEIAVKVQNMAFLFGNSKLNIVLYIYIAFIFLPLLNTAHIGIISWIWA